MSDKSDLVGNPVVGISDGSNDQPSQTTGNNMYKGANGHVSLSMTDIMYIYLYICCIVHATAAFLLL